MKLEKYEMQFKKRHTKCKTQIRKYLITSMTFMKLDNMRQYNIKFN